MLAEVLSTHGLHTGAARAPRIAELLHIVGLKPEHASRFSHEFSGGQRQRIGIARALALDPAFLVCDESVSALDVSVQAQVLNLLNDLKKEYGFTVVFISHDLSVIQHIADKVAVMYLGKIVEFASVEDIFANPQHPYTKALISAVPQINPADRTNRVVLSGDIPSPAAQPSGCHFHPRCPIAVKQCSEVEPQLRSITTADHLVSCHLATGVK
jgi:oligopeptide/dipeptide ABC transporter ATP-binding protein